MLTEVYIQVPALGPTPMYKNDCGGFAAKMLFETRDDKLKHANFGIRV
jgi:hypothetical protein